MEQNEQSSPLLFREVQWFNQIWLWMAVLGLAALQWRLMFKYQMFRPPFTGHSRGEITIFFFWLFFGIILPVFILCCRMITEVREDGIFVRFIPYHRTFQKISFADFSRYEMRTYRPIAEYGGWGVRNGQHGRAYSIKGNHGIELTLQDGSKLLIGSQQVRDFLHAIHTQCAQRRRKDC